MPDQADRRWPSQTELVVGLVGPVGVDLSTVYLQLREVLSGFRYQCHELHLSDQLRALDWDEELVDDPADSRLWSYMSAGNRLCDLWERGDAFALLAINAIWLARSQAGGEPDEPLDRHCFVLRSIKRSEEVELLRNVYGDRFVLLSLYAPKDSRVEHLERRIRATRVHPTPQDPEHTAQELVDRDERESMPGTHGQDVRGVFHRGDFFIDVRRDLKSELLRATELLFGHPNRTPSRDEAGMFHAIAAGRQSAELGRQVGAAICTADGSLLAVGTNEVPKAGGGHYWENDPMDSREFTKRFDTNDVRKAAIVTELVQALRADGFIAEGASETDLTEMLSNSRIDDLIEFVPAVHAEMAAITDAARRGISVQDATLFVTTFPCHGCAGHIVAAGIKRVVYIAPYAKSLAVELHGDALVVDPTTPSDAPEGKICFEPFVGVGPGRYLDVFEAPPRKDHTTGKVLDFDPGAATPRIRDVEVPELQGEYAGYVVREQRALEGLERAQTLPAAPRFR